METASPPLDYAPRSAEKDPRRRVVLASWGSAGAIVLQAPWYFVVGLGAALSRMDQPKSAWLDGIAFSLMGLPSIVAIGLSIAGLLQWRRARWTLLNALVAAAPILPALATLKYLWEEYARLVLHTAQPNWPPF